MAAANRHKLLHWRHNFSPELTLKPAFKLKADNLLDFELYYRIPRFLLINCNVSQHIMVGPKPDLCGCQSQFLSCSFFCSISIALNTMIVMEMRPPQKRIAKQASGNVEIASDTFLRSAGDCNSNASGFTMGGDSD